MRQSLFLNPQLASTSSTANSIWGFYADGFFDRRGRANPQGTSPAANSAVDVNSVNVAVGGRLFFNPRTHYHLFFPFGGRRFNMATLVSS
jgi:hypothetical protein